MALVTGPLMSMSASGTLASAIVFSTWKGKPYVRRHAIPANPRSGKQLGFRAMLRFLSKYWASMPALQQGDWATDADTLHQSGFNRFVGKSQTRWRSMKAPGYDVYPDETGVAPSAGVITATGGIREASLSIADGATAPDFGWLIFALLGGAPTPSLSNLVGVELYTGTPTIFVHTPIEAGAWHYKCIGFLFTGLKGTVSLDATCNVT